MNMATLDFCYFPVNDVPDKPAGHIVRVSIWKLRRRLFSSKRLRFTVLPKVT